ncbi:TrkH family potassium uptake protein [Lentzea flaviverrucosa]|uniref:Potassium uptake protein, TrkH family n=1 Tax=Lentzea flaviverrucosa TaxID=200379 RepID=A0A1H9GHN4_9PSEU|nr:potassium transporter TrkG [Lentzea flaviverrucosa]RDI34905.1 potassium uptake TrkH family protein [Lentzea flaviverrucosa]SEQ49597.1 potassium uptake protein, TrkH family [Lentzea flaviverrucosa]
MITGWRHPARLVVLAFLAATAAGTVLLMLPVAAEPGRTTGFMQALFTAVSGITGTGLAVVDTGSHWSVFGEVLLLVLWQVGGLGIMTLASVLALLVSHRLNLQMQLTVKTETNTLNLGQVRRVVAGVVTISLVVEAIGAVVLALRFWLGYGESFGRALYSGVFHSISSFNSVGLALYPDSLMRYATDPWVCLPIAALSVTGGLGFPVLFELLRRHRKRWSLHTKITVPVYLGLMAFGMLVVLVVEWARAGTLGPYGVGDKLLIGLFHGVMPGSSGFNTVDVAQLQPATLLAYDVLMFVGGGSAGTTGGIKVTTFALLAFVLLAEVRAEPSVHVMGRRLSAEVQRQAVTVALLGVGVVMVSTLVLLATTSFRLDAVLVETTAAFGGVGMSTGITPQLSPTGQLVIIVLMFIGRVGPITLVSSLALRERRRRYELPEERPIVG